MGLLVISLGGAGVARAVTVTGVDYFAAMLILVEMVTIDLFKVEKGFRSWMELAGGYPVTGGSDGLL